MRPVLSSRKLDHIAEWFQHVGAASTFGASAGSWASETATVYCWQPRGDQTTLQALCGNFREFLQVVVVGLDWVTEFQKEGDRSFYHCSLKPCKNEQGNSRCGFEVHWFKTTCVLISEKPVWSSSGINIIQADDAAPPPAAPCSRLAGWARARWPSSSTASTESWATAKV